MRSNEVIQKDIQDAIKWEPLLNAAEIGVTVKEGIVTLTGSVNSYAKKVEAENAAKGVSGVKAVIEKIELHFDHDSQKGDTEIANEIVNAFRWNWEIPEDNIQVRVENGWVTLDGELTWQYQRQTAGKIVGNLTGVKGVVNNIRIKTEMEDIIEKKDIERALVRHWSIDNKYIDVHVHGNRVTLSGHVGSLYQKNEAGRIAWNAPGVWTVENELKIEFVDQ